MVLLALTLAVLVVVLLSLAVVLRAVAVDGLGLRPPPATRAEQERMSTWPR